MSAPDTLSAAHSAGAPLLQVGNVTAFYGDLQALFGISLKVNAGEIVTLIGANGAGKTTALSILLGRRRPDRGEVRLFGNDPRMPQTRCRIGATAFWELRFETRLMER